MSVGFAFQTSLDRASLTFICQSIFRGSAKEPRPFTYPMQQDRLARYIPLVAFVTNLALTKPACALLRSDSPESLPSRLLQGMLSLDLPVKNQLAERWPEERSPGRKKDRCFCATACYIPRYIVVAYLVALVELVAGAALCVPHVCATLCHLSSTVFPLHTRLTRTLLHTSATRLVPRRTLRTPRPPKKERKKGNKKHEITQRHSHVWRGQKRPLFCPSYFGQPTKTFFLRGLGPVASGFQSPRGSQGAGPEGLRMSLMFRFSVGL